MKQLMMVFLCLVISACVSNQYTVVAPGPVHVKNLKVTTDGHWNKTPAMNSVYLKNGNELWTRDGLLLDKLFVFPGVDENYALFSSNSKDLVYPLFDKGMLPNEIVELTKESLTKLYGSDALVESTNLRPHRISGKKAIMFDITINTAEQPTTSGRVAAYIDGGKLYQIIFLASEIYYFDKHWSEAEKLMESMQTLGSS